MNKANVPWSKLWNVKWSWWPGLKETRGPVALLILVVLSIYLLSEFYLFTVVDSSPPGVVLPISTNSSNAPCYASPICVIDVKSLFLSPMDFYLNKPAAISLNRALSLDSFMSANFASFSHILFSLASIRLIAHDNLCVRRLGVLLFATRNLFDSLDGVIARADAEKMRKIPEQTQLPQEFVAPWTVVKPENQLLTQQTLSSSASSNESWLTFGYLIDGICDGIGCIFLMIACLIHLQRHPHRKNQIAYSPLNLVTINGMRNSNGVSSGTTNGIVNNKTTSVKGEFNSKPFTKKIKNDDDDDNYVEPSTPLFSFLFIFSQLAENIRKFIVTIRTSLSCGTGVPAALYLVQLLFSSLCWNRNIIVYSKKLEVSPTDTDDDNQFKSNVIHSTIMWLVIYLWRIVNPLNMTETLLLAIFFDRMADLLQLLQYSGFLIIFCVAAFSELHHSDLVN